MATRIASGQITIVDLNDGKAVQAFTSTSQGDTQIYSPNENSYSPNYTNSPLMAQYDKHVEKQKDEKQDQKRGGGDNGKTSE